MGTTEQQPDLSHFWNEKEAARFLGLSIQFLQQDRVRDRRIPFCKIGRAVRYDPNDVLAFARSCKIGKPTHTVET